ncbi:MAG: transcriptional regulator [Minisyncoccia bacterium]
MHSYSTLRILEDQSGNLRVLVFLLDIKETNFQNIVEELPITGRSLYGAIDKLKELGLIKTRIDKSSYPQKNMISLTEKGKQVAERLKEIEEVLNK